MIESCDLCIRCELCGVTPELEAHVEECGCDLFVCRIQVSDDGYAGDVVEG